MARPRTQFGPERPPPPRWKDWIRVYLERGGVEANAPKPFLWLTYDNRPRCARCTSVLGTQKDYEVTAQLGGVPSCFGCFKLVEAVVSAGV